MSKTKLFTCQCCFEKVTEEEITENGVCEYCEEETNVWSPCSMEIWETYN